MQALVSPIPAWREFFSESAQPLKSMEGPQSILFFSGRVSPISRG
jgi:hypothetical protein